MWNIEDSGIDQNALRRYVEEQIFTLPGTDKHREQFTVLLTGSRAMGTHTHESDVDVDVLCPESVYRSVQQASREAGITRSRSTFFAPLSVSDEDWGRYFGADRGVPHFSLNTLESVRRQLEEYDDVALWIWTNARIIHDPEDQFRRIRDEFRRYPRDVLARKLKYHWLLCWYWVIDVCPCYSRTDEDLIVAATGVLNGILEMMKVFFLVEGRPYPYTEKLPQLVHTTRLGKEFGPLLQRWTDLAVGKIEPQLPAWKRLEKAIDQMLDDEDDPETVRLEEACVRAITDAGVEPEWMENYFCNIDELLLGQLGPRS